MMDMEAIRQLYDRELRMSVEYAGVRCEQTPHVTLGPYSYDPAHDTFISQDGTAHAV